MGLFKGIKIPDRLVGIINYMKSLEETRESLTVLGQQWDLLSILGKMSNTGTDMTRTREGFKDLTADLLGTLGNETLKKILLSMTSKAQVTVDIVIRNLFERTADIGFLATDDDLRKFLSGAEGYTPEHVKNRFAEYVAKYSVYENILLLDTNGIVKCQLRDDNLVEKSSDPLIQESIETKGAYLETYRWSDLNPKDPKTLIYSYRITKENKPNSPVIGVLCLVFRFENELKGIFKNLISEGDWTVLTLLDHDGKVIASSDTSQIPISSEMKFNPDSEFEIVRFGGKAYIAKTCRTKGYQGYMGLGWYGHAMLSLELAFDGAEVDRVDQVNPKIFEALMESPRLFSEELRRIPKNASRIQSELDRTVWNGNVVMRDTEGEKSKLNERKVLLWEISSTGARTKSIFEESIKALHKTVISSIMSDADFISFLAIDIMDRNLYERANDCRWWALTTAFREALSQERLSDTDRQSLSEILKYINGLYTVYTNLILFDRTGTVIAISNPAFSNLVGTVPGEPIIRDILALNGHDRYTASSFTPSALYGGEPTYIYGAPIRANNGTDKIVGGIAIVFDGKPQFKAMLEDSVPKKETGESVDGAFSVFCDRQKRIIASSTSEIKAGELLEISEDFSSLKCGEGTSKIIVYKSRYYALGIRISKGYREYKSESDSYKNDIVSLSFILLGNVETDIAKSQSVNYEKFRMEPKALQADAQYKEIATFIVGDSWLGLESDQVIEAILVDSITPLPGFSEGLFGTVLYRGSPIGVLKPHHVIGSSYQKASNHLIVVLKNGGTLTGLLVDRLGQIPEVDIKEIHASPDLRGSNSNFIEGIISAQNEMGSSMLILINSAKFIEAILSSTLKDDQSIVAELKKLGTPNSSPSNSEPEESEDLQVLHSLKGIS